MKSFVSKNLIAFSMLLCAVLICAQFAVIISYKMPLEGGIIKASETIVYQSDFGSVADGALPEGYALSSSTAAFGTAAVNSGVLELKTTSNDNANRPMLRLPSTLTCPENFRISVEFAISRASDDTRFVGFMYNYTEVDANPKYYQMAVRVRAKTATNGGVEVAGFDNGAWVNTNSSPASADLVKGDYYKAVVEVAGGRITQYLGGYKTHDKIKIADGYTAGNFGIQVSNSDVSVKNIKVEELPLVNFYSELATTYQPTTELVTPPSVYYKVDTSAALTVLSTAVGGAGARPAGALFAINDTGAIVSNDGTVLGSLDDIMSVVYTKVIPAFEVNSVAQADKLIAFITSTTLIDAFVVSSDTALVAKVRTACPKVRSMVRYSKLEYTKAEYQGLRDETHKSSSKIALLDINAAKAETVDYLQRRGVTVFVDGVADKLTAHDVISRGVNGLVTKDFESAYTAMTVYGANSLARVPYTIAHRGYSAKYAENTLKAAKAAYDNGADVIECDLYITKDEVPVILHDAALSITTTGSGDVEAFTLAQVKAFNIKSDPSCKVPTVEEFFVEFKDKDILHFIEIKSTKPKAVDALKALIDKHGVSNQVVVITFEEMQLRRVRQLIPEVSVGYLTQSNATLNNIDKLAELNATMNPRVDYYTADVLNAYKDRGITVWPWTYAESQFNFGMTSGVGGLTTNHCNQGAKMIEKIVPKKTSYVFGRASDSAMTVDATAYFKDGTTAVVNCSYKLVDGSLRLIKLSGDKYYAREEATAKAILTYDVVTSSGSLLYTITSEVVDFEGKVGGGYVPEEPEEPEEPDNPDNPGGEDPNPDNPGGEDPPKPDGKEEGCGSMAGVSGTTLAALAALALVVMTAKKRRALKR